MAKVKQPHHKGTHQARAAKICAAAYANPLHRCWRCGRTLAQIRKLKPRATWTAGHLVDGQVDGPMEAECSPCNYGHGAALGNRNRKQRRILRATPARRPTEYTW